MDKDYKSKNNDDFLNLYNRLDNYLKKISGLGGKSGSLIYCFEEILPEEKSAYFKTIRMTKNINFSHGTKPEGESVQIPAGWNRFLEEMLEYCKDPKNRVAERIRNKYNELNEKRDNAHADSQVAKGTIRKSSQSGTTPKEQSKSEKLSDYIKSKAAIIEKRIARLDAEFIEKCIPKDARDGIKDSAKCYLDLVQKSKSKAAVDSNFKLFQKKFADIRQHPSVVKYEKAKHNVNKAPENKKSVIATPINRQITDNVSAGTSDKSKVVIKDAVGLFTVELLPGLGWTKNIFSRDVFQCVLKVDYDGVYHLKSLKANIKISYANFDYYINDKTIELGRNDLKNTVKDEKSGEVTRRHPPVPDRAGLTKVSITVEAIFKTGERWRKKTLTPRPEVECIF